MRFLILFAAALACAAAAPSHLLPYAAYTAIPAIPIGAVPTVSPGDIQAAAIDAHVKAADFAQEAVDRARLVSEQAVENLNTQVITNVDQDKERLTDAFWATEDKKWQAFDALKTAEAQIDGALANNAGILAKTAVGAPYIATVNAVAPVAPVANVVFGAPALKSFSSQTVIQSHPAAAEAAKAEGDSEKVEAAAKAAEPAKEAEAEKEKSAETAAADAAAELKSEADKAFAALKANVIAPVAVAGAFPYTAAYPYSGVAVAPAFTSAIAPAIAPAIAYAHPGFKYASTVQHVGPLATSTILKTQW